MEEETLPYKSLSIYFKSIFNFIVSLREHLFCFVLINSFLIGIIKKVNKVFIIEELTMISYIKGELIRIYEEGIIIEQNGLGYEVKMSLSTLDQLPKAGSIIKVYTYLHVREDILALYGFIDYEDLDTFKLLITVNGIGPKGALGILSAITPNDLRYAILSEDVKTITKAPGIGVKTARKLILELKDKFNLEDVFETSIEKKESVTSSSSNNNMRIRRETIEALVV